MEEERETSRSKWKIVFLLLELKRVTSVLFKHSTHLVAHPFHLETKSPISMITLIVVSPGTWQTR